jgi:hypothetical protein
MIQYRKETTGQDYIVRTNEDGSESWIPTDPTNADYQSYLNKYTLPSNSSIPQAGE